MESAYLQVASIGLLWTTVHCTGMCGPLIAGVTTRPGDGGDRLRRLGLRSRRVVAYQAGRALTYAALGATAGLLGAAVEGSVRSITGVTAAAMAIVFAALGIAELTGKFRAPSGGRLGALLPAVLRRARRLPFVSSDLGLAFVTGIAFGFLPCMLAFWVLGVAASTASPLHGAGTMVLLVLLTTPSLLLAACGSALLDRRLGKRAVGVALLFSAVWLGLVAAAANGIIEHRHFVFSVAGEPFMLMLF